MLNQLRTFFDHSRHKLIVRNVDAKLDVLAFEGSEGLSQLFTYRVEFTCTDRDIAAEQRYRLELANGVSYQLPVPTEYRNAEQAQLANSGLHNHSGQTDAEVKQPASHTDPRALYTAVMKGISDKEGKNQ